MSVRTLCLAILSFGDATGYEIRKLSTEGRYSYFVDASFGSIYPALARLEADGLVTVREEAQSGKPSRKIYSITEAGRAAFIDALSETPGPDTFRSPFLLVAMCADLVVADTIRAAIDHRLLVVCVGEGVAPEHALIRELRKRASAVRSGSGSRSVPVSCRSSLRLPRRRLQR